MTPEEFAIARQKLGWTDGQLAAELNVSEKIVHRWADGGLKIPKSDAQRIEWEAALAEREAALQAAGLGECDWMKSWEAKALPAREKDLDAHFKQVDDHAEHCSTCQAREQFLKERFSPMPAMPTSGLVSAFQRWHRFLQRFPDWAHPVLNGAAILTILVLIRVVITLPRGVSPGVLIAVPVGAALGAFAGLVYSALRSYIAAGGTRKIIAYVLVLASYATLPAAFGAYDGDDLRFSLVGMVVTLSVLAVVFLFWLLGRRKKN
jgi:hypothetical protein